MFDIGWSELLVIAVVAIVVIGPKDLPRALRSVGQWTGRIKRMASDFQGQFTEAIREAELDAVQRDIEEIGKMDPLADIRNAAAETGASIQRDLDRATTGPSATATFGGERTLYPWEISSPDSAPPAVSPAPVVSDATTPPAAAVEQKP